MTNEHEKIITALKTVGTITNEVAKEGLSIARKEPIIKEFPKTKTAQFVDKVHSPTLNYSGERVVVTKCCMDGVCPHHLATILFMDDKMEVMQKIMEDGIDIMEQKGIEEIKKDIVGQDFEGTLVFVKNPQWLSGKIETDIFTGFAKFNEIFNNGNEFKDKCPSGTQIKGKLVILPSKGDKDPQATITMLEMEQPEPTIKDDTPTVLGEIVNNDEIEPSLQDDSQTTSVTPYKPVGDDVVSRSRKATSGTSMYKPVEGDVVPRGAVSLEEMGEIVDNINKFLCKKLIPDEDYGKIPGTKKPTLLKPGAEKITRFFGCVAIPTILKEKDDWNTPFFMYRIRTDIVRLKDGVVIAYGYGSCNSFEGKYYDRIQKQYKQDPFFLNNTCMKMAKKRSHVDATMTLPGVSVQFTQDMEDLDR